MNNEKNRRPYFSVVIPTYNRKNRLLGALQSVLDQSFPDFEIIVIDDGSTDGTCDVVSELEDERIRYISHMECCGANVARNTGLKEAKGSYIAFLDSDDIFLEHKLRTIACQSQIYPDAAIFLSSSVQVSPQKIATYYHPSVELKPYEFRRLLCLYLLDPSTSGIVVKRDAIMQQNGFTETLKRMQDREMLLRLSETYGCIITEEVLWKKFWSEDGISSYTDGYLTALIEVLNSHDFFERDHKEAVDYLVFRTISRQIRGKRFSSAISDLRLLVKHRRLRLNLLEVYFNYRRIRKVRRNYRSEKRKIRLRNEYNQIVSNTHENCKRDFMEFKAKFPSIFEAAF